MNIAFSKRTGMLAGGVSLAAIAFVAFNIGPIQGPFRFENPVPQPADERRAKDDATASLVDAVGKKTEEQSTVVSAEPAKPASQQQTANGTVRRFKYRGRQSGSARGGTDGERSRTDGRKRSPHGRTRRCSLPESGCAHKASSVRARKATCGSLRRPPIIRTSRYTRTRAATSSPISRPIRLSWSAKHRSRPSPSMSIRRPMPLSARRSITACCRRRIAVRVEEMINYFDYSYPLPDDRAVAVQRRRHDHAYALEYRKQAAAHRHQGIRHSQGRGAEGKPGLLIDTSGSMNAPDKLPLLRNAFKLLVSSPET